MLTSGRAGSTGSRRQNRNKCKARTCCKRIDGKILDARMSSWRKELQDFECADHQDRDANRGEPLSRIGKSKREPDQDKSERMLNVLTEIRMRSVLRRAKGCKGHGYGQ